MELMYNGYDCKVRFGQYYNGVVAMELVEKITGEIVVRASVNPDFHVPFPHVVIKVWGENEGVVHPLVVGGILEEQAVVEYLPMGYAHAEVHTLTEEAREEFKQQTGGIF